MRLSEIGKIALCVMCLAIGLFPLANAADSSINDTYQITIYVGENPWNLHDAGLRARIGVPAIRFMIRVSLQTENDGTWKGNNSYLGLIEASLDWYDHTIFPYGLEVSIEPKVDTLEYPWWQDEYQNKAENVTFYAGSISIGDSSSVFDWETSNMVIKPNPLAWQVPPYEPPYTVPLRLEFWCSVFNGSRTHPVGQYIYYSRLFNIVRTPQETSNVATSLTELINVKNLLYALIALVAVLAGLNIVQVLFIRKQYGRK